MMSAEFREQYCLNAIARLEKDIAYHEDHNDGTLRWVDDLRDMLLELDQLNDKLLEIHMGGLESDRYAC